MLDVLIKLALFGGAFVAKQLRFFIFFFSMLDRSDIKWLGDFLCSSGQNASEASSSFNPRSGWVFLLGKCYCFVMFQQGCNGFVLEQRKH